MFKTMRSTQSGLVALLVASTLAACGGSPSKESTGEYIDDTAITTRIKASYFQDEDVKGSTIQVDTFKGNVQLSGTADSRVGIDRAVQIARDVPGVKSVRNDIRLKPMK